MRWTARLVVALLLLGSQPTLAVNVFFTGADLLKRCDPDPAVPTCIAYVIGANDAYELAFAAVGVPKPEGTASYCVPDDAAARQLAGVVAKYLRAHPEKLHLGAASIVWTALSQAFPCAE